MATYFALFAAIAIAVILSPKNVATQNISSTGIADNATTPVDTTTPISDSSKRPFVYFYPI